METANPRLPAWQRHLRDPDVWQTALVATSLLMMSLGTLWAVYLHRVWRTARIAPQDIAGSHCLLVFGKRLRKGAADADLRARIACTHRLLGSGNVHSLVLLGGPVGAERSEASVAHELLRDLGLGAAIPVQLEEASGDTLENLRHARALLAERQIDRVVLLSNRYHLARCTLLADSIGLTHSVCAAEQRWQEHPRHWAMLCKEASLSFWLDVGIRWARFTGHRRMLSKLS